MITPPQMQESVVTLQTTTVVEFNEDLNVETLISTDETDDDDGKNSKEIPPMKEDQDNEEPREETKSQKWD